MSNDIQPPTTDKLIGAISEAAAAGDAQGAGNSGLNGRLQRIAQRLTSLIALLPTALAANGGLSTNETGTGTNASSQVTISNSSATVIASRAGRRGVLIVNLQTVAVYLDPTGGTASTSTHFRLDPGASVFLPITTAVTGITAASYSASPADARLHLVELY